MGAPTSPRGSVLVVDDYGPFCEMLETALELAGFTSLSAPGGSTAVERAIAAGGVDVALVDLGLPDRPGLEVAEELLARGLAARCVLMSGSPSDDLEWPDGWAGERTVLLKPYAMGELLQRIGTAIDEARPAAGAGESRHGSRAR